MAANAAHLTRTLNEKPSVFEVIAQESLHSTVQPALRRVFEVNIYFTNHFVFLIFFTFINLISLLVYCFSQSEETKLAGALV